MIEGWLIIDGYSLLYRDRRPFASDRPTAAERTSLLRRLERIVGHAVTRITVVFDGRSEGGPDASYVGPIEVIYSPSSMTADSVIERMVHAHLGAGGRLVTVVTSDRRERETVEATGARTISCGDFLDWFRQEERRYAAPCRAPAPAWKPTIGDRFPSTPEAEGSPQP